MEKTVETRADFILGGSKITADGDCSHEIKRHLLLGGKAMTNLDSIFVNKGLSSQDYVDVVVFPVVMYGCESWTIKKAERRRIDAFKLWCWRRLESPLDCQLILKEIILEYSLEGLMLKPQYFGHLMQRIDSLKRSWCWERLKAEEKGKTEDKMVGWHHLLNGCEFEQALGVDDGQGSLVCCTPWGRKETDRTVTELN